MTSLRDPFDHTFKKDIKKNGQVVAQVDYVGWSQVADRLDEAAPGWSFTIRQLGEDWCWGQLTIDGRTFDNIGYAENADADWKKEALKDAVSDALKRCAALAGVARYLYDKDSHRPQAARTAPAPAPTRSSTQLPEDVEFESLSPTPPGQLMTFRQLADLAEAKGIEKNAIYQTADKMFGPRTKVTDLDGGARYAIAVEMGLVA